MEDDDGPRTEAPAGQNGSSRHLIIVMSPFLMSAGASTLMCLSCTWMIGRSRGRVHAVGAELDRSVERADVGLASASRTFFLSVEPARSIAFCSTTAAAAHEA